MPGSPKKGKKGAVKEDKKDPNAMPLLDEVNELLEKEKLLINLKLLEQKKEADEWKSKYDQLVSQVVESASVTGDFQALEIAADIEQRVNQDVLINGDMDHDLADVLMSHKVVDLSGNLTTAADLTKIAKDITISKGKRNPTHVLMRQTGVSDASAPQVMNLLKIPTVDAIDLSGNDLGPAFEDQLIEMLKTRRKTPQYILLHGNMAGSLASHFSDIFHLLTERTWGLSVSLQDLAVTPSAAARPGTTAKSKGASAQQLDFMGSAKRVMCCNNFLKVLNSSYAQETDDAGGSKATGGKAAAGKAKAAGPAVKGSGRIRPVDKREGGLQLLSVFGLTDAQLSKESIDLLSKTLLYTTASLTDVDLSRCYLAIPGAEMLRDALSRADCNLIRLAAGGNCFNDLGASMIADGLVDTKTLTHLDLSSNDMSSKGLISLCTAAIRSNVLSVLDVRGNLISRSDCLLAEESLVSAGSSVKLRWQTLVPLQEKFMKDNTFPGGKLLFSSPIIVKEELSGATPSVLFHALDSMRMSANAAITEDEGRPLLLRWKMRLVGSSLNATTSSSRLSARAASRDAARDMPVINWEIRLSTSSEDKTLIEGRVPTLCEAPPTGSGDENERAGRWVECRTMILSPPKKGTIELWLVFGGSDEATRSGRVTAEVHSFTAQSVSQDQQMWVGGDSDALTVAANALASDRVMANLNKTHVRNLAASIPEGHTLVRVLNWNAFSSNKASVTFDAKLAAVAPVLASQEAEPLTSEHATKAQGSSSIGYAWSVILVRAHGTVQIVADGSCSSLDGRSADSILTPWQWHTWSASLPLVMPNDIVLISMKVRSDTGARNAIARCTTQARRCQLSIDMESLLVKEDAKLTHNMKLLGGLESTFVSSAVHNSSGFVYE
jgi:hypothetical protein